MGCEESERRVQAGTDLTIARMANIYGVSQRTLRFYEARNLLQPTRLGNSTIFTKQDRIRLELILKGRKLGFSLAEIEILIWQHTPDATDPSQGRFAGALSLANIREQIEHLERRRAETVAAIADLRAAMARLA